MQAAASGFQAKTPSRRLVLLVAAFASFAQAQDSTIASRGDKRLVPASAQAALPIEEGNRWALLIGVNDYGFATPLRFCVRDMEAYQETLVRHGGYAPENVFLLVDSSDDRSRQPSRGNIYNTLQRICSQAGENDTILVAFSGHGELDGDGYAYLMPSDGSIESLAVTGLPVAQIHQLLIGSPARQKILIVDACHAGGKRGAATFDLGRVPDFPAGEGFVEMLSCRSDEVSWEDEEKRHGLFSYYLLDGITGGKADRGPEGNRDGYVSVSEAMSHVEGNLRDHFRKNRKYSGRSQTPVIRTREQTGTIVLAKVEGEVAVPPTFTGEADIAVLTLPGLSGRWWFEDTPWLAPQIRPHVSQLMPQVRTVARPIDRELPKPIGGLYNPHIGEVHEQLAGAFSQYVAQQDFTRQRFLRRLRNLRWDELRDDDAASIVDGVSHLHDPHLSALVQHKLGLEQAEQSYEAALSRYQEAANSADAGAGTALGLYSLCLSDMGWWQFNSSRYHESALNFREARDVLAGTQADTPLFDIVAICSEAQAYRKLGDWRAVNRLMAMAQSISDERLTDVHPLRAHVYERNAWALMDQWHCRAAEENFLEALRLRQAALEQHLDADAEWAQISCFHNQHGLAMAKRFAGQLDESRREYTELLGTISQAIRGRPSPDFAGRLVNTMERLADTYLFTHEPTADRAWMILGDAYDSTKYLAPDTRTATCGQILCKRAIAAALRGQPDQAKAQLTSLDELDLQDTQRDRLLVYRDVAEALMLLENAKGDAAEIETGRTRLRGILAHFTGEGTPDSSGANNYGETRETLRREILELLLLAWDRLIHSQKEAEPIAADIATAFELVPSQFLLPAELPTGNADQSVAAAPPILGFLRPYYTEAIRAELAASKSAEVIYTIRHVKLAQTGSDFFPRPYLPVLVPVLFDEKGYALCYSPRGDNRVIPFDLGWKSLQQASGSQPAKLPQAVQEWLARADEQVTVIWTYEASFPFEAPANLKLVDRF